MDNPLHDFRNFLYLVWKHLNLPDPTPVQYDIAQYLQHGPRRCIIEAFRGVGKSWITVAYVCWRLYLDPQTKILVVSASKQLADNFSTFALQLINELPELRHLRPKDGQRNAKNQFDVGPARASKDPSVKSVGITGQITGTRADLIIPDDIEVPGNSATQMMRDKLSELVKEFDAILKPEGQIKFLGTPQTEMSLYNALSERGYEVRIWPARFPDEVRLDNYGDRLAPFIADQLARQPGLINRPTDPRRFADEDLKEREASYGRSGFALQFMLDTRLSDQERYPLKVSDLIVMDLNPDMAPEKVVWARAPELILNDVPNVAFNGDKFYRPMAIQGEWIPYQGSVMFIDPAGRGKDETAYAVVKMLNSQLFLLDAGGFQGGYSDETLKALTMLAKQYKVNWVRIESNFGDGMFTQLLTPVMSRVHPVTIDEIRHTGQKELRIIDTLEPVLNQHKLIIDRKLIEKDYRSTDGYPLESRQKYQLFYQMTRLTRERGALLHDDRLEAVAGAVHYWVEQMSRDVDRAILDEKDRRFKLEYDRFVEHVVGHKPKPTTWLDMPSYS